LFDINQINNSQRTLSIISRNKKLNSAEKQRVSYESRLTFNNF